VCRHISTIRQLSTPQNVNAQSSLSFFTSLMTLSKSLPLSAASNLGSDAKRDSMRLSCCRTIKINYLFTIHHDVWYVIWIVLIVDRRVEPNNNTIPSRHNSHRGVQVIRYDIDTNTDTFMETTIHYIIDDNVHVKHLFQVQVKTTFLIFGSGEECRCWLDGGSRRSDAPSREDWRWWRKGNSTRE